MYSDTSVSLGAVCVLDPEKLRIGTRVVIDGELLYVHDIIGENVYFKAVIGSELFAYKMKQFWANYKIPIIVTGATVISVILYATYAAIQ